MTQDRSLRIITPVVVGFHAILILWMLLFSPAPTPAVRSAPQKLVVSTIQLNPQKIEAMPVPDPEPDVIAAADPLPEPEPEPLQPLPPPPPKPKPAAKKPAPAPKPQPKPKPTPPPKPKPAPKQPAPKPKPQPAAPKKPVVDQNKAELIAKAQASMQKIDKTVHLGSVSSIDIESLTIETGSTLNAPEISYRDEIASRLKLQLKLPEMGEVKLKLTLNSLGSVTNVEIIQSASKANKSYVQTKIATLKFPAFGNNFGKAQNYTFTIALSNEL